MMKLFESREAFDHAVAQGDVKEAEICEVHYDGRIAFMAKYPMGRYCIGFTPQRDKKDDTRRERTLKKAKWVRANGWCGPNHPDHPNDLECMYCGALTPMNAFVRTTKNTTPCSCLTLPTLTAGS